MTAALQQQHVVSHVVGKLWSIKISCPNTSTSNLCFHQVQRFGRSHVLKIYHPNSHMHLELVFCEKFCVQMTVCNQNRIRKSSIERRDLFMMKTVSIMNICFNQYNALLNKIRSNSIE